MCELGQTLKAAREAQGKTVAELAAKLAVRKAVLEALEDCRFSDLPEAALSRGYLRRYAELLGLDPQPLLRLYPQSTETPVAIKLPPKPSPWRWVWVGLVVAALAAAGYWYYNSSRPDATPQTAPTVQAPERVSLRVEAEPAGARVFLDGFLLGAAPVEVQVEVGNRTLRLEANGYQPLQTTLNLSETRSVRYNLKPAPSSNPQNAAPATGTPPGVTTSPSTPPASTPTTPPATAPATSPATPPATAPATNQVVLRFESRSWIRVTTLDGRRLFEGQPAIGSQQSYDQPVLVRAGNGAGVRAVVNGQDVGRLGAPGQVVTRTLGRP